MFFLQRSCIETNPTFKFTITPYLFYFNENSTSIQSNNMSNTKIPSQNKLNEFGKINIYE